MPPAIPPLKHILVVADRMWWSEGPSLLGPFLAQHPARVEDLWRFVPEVKGGLCMHWTVTNDHLVLERLEVTGLEDPLVEMALWHALFPGLKRPLKAWWSNGSQEVKDREDLPLPHTVIRPLVRGRATYTLVMDRGRVVAQGSDITTPVTWRRQDPFEWPLVPRLLLAPLVLILGPVSVIGVMIKGQRAKDPLPLWVVLLIPFFTVTLLLKLLFPKAFEAYLEPYMDRIGNSFQRRRAVEDLVKEALQREVPRQDRV